MSISPLSSLESQIESLSLPEQLALMESLARQIRVRAAPQSPATDWNFEAMARDQDIQRELREIEVDFQGTEGDGLELS